MTVSFILAWWHLPALATVLLGVYALWPRKDEQGAGYGAGFSAIGALFRCLCVALLVAVLWAIAGALK